MTEREEHEMRQLEAIRDEWLALQEREPFVEAVIRAIREVDGGPATMERVGIVHEAARTLAGRKS